MAIRYFILLAFVVILPGCSSTSGGLVLGTEGSPAWHKYAPASDVRRYWSSKSMVFMRTKWDSSYDIPRIRDAIGQELKRRGEDPMSFYNATADNDRRIADEVSATRAAAEAAKREARAAKQKAEKLQNDREWDCIMQGRVC